MNETVSAMLPLMELGALASCRCKHKESWVRESITLVVVLVVHHIGFILQVMDLFFVLFGVF